MGHGLPKDRARRNFCRDGAGGCCWEQLGRTHVGDVACVWPRSQHLTQCLPPHVHAWFRWGRGGEGPKHYLAMGQRKGGNERVTRLLPER